jgi:uncharacterized oxidoreductase
MDLVNKRIVITGGTSGIGLEIVRLLARDNSIIVLGRRDEQLKEIPNTKFIHCELSKRSSVEKAAEKIINSNDTIDILINNAAVQYTPKFLDKDFSYEGIEREIQINFVSICQLTYLLLPLMQKGKAACILNINSGLGLAPKTQSAVYCATKAALHSFSKSLMYQFEGKQIMVLQAFLPLVDTAMTLGRGDRKMSPKMAAKNIVQGLSNESVENNIGKVSFLRFLLRLWPALAFRILRRA